MEALELEHELDGECRKCPGNCGVIVTFGFEASDKVVTLAPPIAGDMGGEMYAFSGCELLLLLLLLLL